MKQWDSDNLFSGVKVLSVRLMGLIGLNPIGFTIIKPILPDIEKLLSKPDVQSDSSLMVPLINDLEVFLHYEEGLDWLLNSGNLRWFLIGLMVIKTKILVILEYLKKLMRK
jgi:hypothetical protein